MGGGPGSGIWRSEDGGETWERVLWRNERTGIGEVVMDPRNPDKLFAAMWEYRREPWFLTSGGPGSGLFVTHDGGVPVYSTLIDTRGTPRLYASRPSERIWQESRL